VGNSHGADRIELLQGTLDLLIMQTLRLGPRHGYGLSQLIRTNSGERLQVDTGSLYPALHRLERRGWVTSEWARSENNQRAKVYALTETGRAQLVAERDRWSELSAAVAGVLQGGPVPAGGSVRRGKGEA
jgi:PadR family transcriptional regulator, regulatory protein PadR